MKKYLIIFLLLFYCAAEAQSLRTIRKRAKKATSSVVVEDVTKWYLSNTGSDANSGHAPELPLQTITGLMTHSLASGDTVLFLADGIWREQLTITQTGVTVTRYGVGANPIISGAIPKTTWVYDGGNTWATAISDEVFDVWVNGVQQVWARYPNRGQYNNQYLNVASGTGTTKVVLSGASFTEDILVNAELDIRAVQWMNNIRTIRSNKNDSVCVSVPLGWTPEIGWGAFIQGNVASLQDTTHEWRWDGDSLRLRLATGENPSSFNIEATTLDYGLTCNQTVTVDGIQFEKQALAGINIPGTPANVSIKNNLIWAQKGIGVEFEGAATGINVTGNTIKSTGWFAIDAYSVTSGLIDNNTIRSIAVIPGSCEQAFGIFGGVGTRVTNNNIDSVGYTAIYARSYMWVYGNIIKHWCMSLTDGGAIYADQASYVWVFNNICYDGVLFTPSNGSPGYTTVVGGYFDNATLSSRMEGNVFIRTGNGAIFTQYNSNADTIRNNMCYNVGGGQWVGVIQVMKDSTFINPYTHVIRGNSVFNDADVTTPFFYQYDKYMRYKSWRTVGSLDSNKYYNPYNWTTPFRYEAGVDPNNFACLPTMQQQKDSTGQEANSICTYHKTYSQFTVAESLFVNETNSPLELTIAANSWKHPLTGVWNSTSLILPAKSCSLLTYDTEAAVTYDRDTVTASNRDAYGITGYLVATDEGSLNIGEAGGYEYEVGASFKLNIARNATIDSARVFMTTYFVTGTWNSTDTISIRAYAVDNVTAFADGEENNVLGHATLGTDSVAWSNTSGTADVVNMSPDIKTIIQSLVNRRSWTSGNYIGLTFDIIRHKHTAHQVTFYGGEIALATAPRIIVYYH